MSTLRRITSKAERRYARRQRACDWMDAYRRNRADRMPIAGYKVRVVDLALHHAPIRLPPKPWHWPDPIMRRRVYKAVWYDDLLVLEWEAAALVTRLRQKAMPDYPLVPEPDPVVEEAVR
jgi:hypothetical protein